MDSNHIVRVLIRDRARLLGYVWAIGRDAHLADDVFQDVTVLAIAAGRTRDDKPPAADKLPYLVLFNSQGDRGLVIDRVWVTRGGPGVMRYKDVE